MKKSFCSWSGGKDAMLSFYRKAKDENISYFLNMAQADGERSRSHGISSKFLKLQAKALGVKLFQGRTSWDGYEQAYRSALLSLKQEGVNTGIFGDIDFMPHREWVERVCQESEIKAILPLWKEKREVLLDEFLTAGFKAVVIATDNQYLGKEWLGRELNRGFIDDLKSMDDIDLCGERGEYHTFVWDGPIFKNPVEFKPGKKWLDDKYWRLELI